MGTGMQKCPNCGLIAVPGEKTCYKCKTPLPAEQEHVTSSHTEQDAPLQDHFPLTMPETYPPAQVVDVPMIIMSLFFLGAAGLSFWVLQKNWWSHLIPVLPGLLGVTGLYVAFFPKHLHFGFDPQGEMKPASALILMLGVICTLVGLVGSFVGSSGPSLESLTLEELNSRGTACGSDYWCGNKYFGAATERDPGFAKAWHNWGVSKVKGSAEPGFTIYFAVALNSSSNAKEKTIQGFLDAAVERFAKACELGFEASCKQAQVCSSFSTWHTCIDTSAYIGTNATDGQATVREGTTGSDTAEQYYTKGFDYAVQGAFDQAGEQFHRALSVDPLYRHAKGGLKTIEAVARQEIQRESAIHLFKGTDHRVNGRLSESIEEFEKAIALSPGYALAYNERGFTYMERNQYDKAVSDFTKALELNSSLVEPYVNRGIVHFKRGNVDGAMSDFTKALQIDPKVPEPYINRGVIYYSKGLYDQAIADYTKALELKPTFAEIWFNKALACERAGRKTEAISAYKGFLQYGATESANREYLDEAKRRLAELGDSK